MAFNPDEPRDERGRWTGSGAPALAGGGWRDRPLFDKSSAGRGAALSMHANLSMRETFRRRPRWSDPASAESLGRLLPRWNAAAQLDDDAFRDRYLGHGVSEGATRAIRVAARLAMRAQTSGEMARAGDHLATAIQVIGVEDWPRVLRVAEVKAESASEIDAEADTQPIDSNINTLSDISGAGQTYKLIPSVFAGYDAVKFGFGYGSIEGFSFSLPSRQNLDDTWTSSFETYPGLGVATVVSKPGGGARFAYGVFDSAKDANGNFILREATQDEAIGIEVQNQIARDAQARQVFIAGAWYYVAFAGGFVSLLAEGALANAARGREPLGKIVVPIKPPVGGNPALTSLGHMRDAAGNAIPVLEANNTFAFARTPSIAGTGTNLEAASADLVQQEPGFISTFDVKAANGNGFDVPYAKLVDGEPRLFVVEDKAGAQTGSLTAFGEGPRGQAQLRANSTKLADAIRSSDILDTYKPALIDQATNRRFSVEFHVSDISNVPRNRFDFLNRIGLTLDRIVVIPGE
jgi:hypothetical protein